MCKIDFDGIVSFIEEQSKNNQIKSLKKWASKYMREEDCKSCGGSRLNLESSNYKISNYPIHQVAQMDMYKLKGWLSDTQKNLTSSKLIIASQVIKEIEKRVQLIIDVGLDYLNLNRSSKTLSGGEAQRIRLATQIGTQLTNVLYILDEPSIGLHQRDNQKLIDSLKKLRDIGNTVIVVEHDRDMILQADYIVDMGQGAGVEGGEIVSQGNTKKFLKLIVLPHYI